MGDNAAKADEYKKQAEKKMKGFGFFGNKYEEAAELYEKAGNNYKLAKCWNDAVEVYEALAECQLKCDSKHEAATAYVEASRAASKVQPAKSTELLHKAVGLYTDMGRLNMAARQLKEIAETNEKQGLKEEAIRFYDQASELFECEGSTSEATKCRLKIAEFSAELAKYPRAVDIFEEAARKAVDNNLLKFSARGYLLNAGICYLCYGSVDDIETKIEQYRDIDLQFGGSREDTLLTSLHEAFSDSNDQAFSTALAEFDKVTRLDAWKTKILLEAKRRLQDMQLGVGGGGDDEEDDDELC
eukprot:gene23303-30540_t